MIYTVRKSEEKSFLGKDGQTVNGFEVIAEDARGSAVRVFISDKHIDVCPVVKCDKLDLALTKYGKLLDVCRADINERG